MLRKIPGPKIQFSKILYVPKNISENLGHHPSQFGDVTGLTVKL